MTRVIGTTSIVEFHRKLLTEASVYVLLVERLSELKKLLSSIVPCLEEAFPEPHMIPPFVCFTSFARDPLHESNESWSESEEEDVLSCFHDLNLKVAIKTVSITDYLTQIKNRLYREYCRERNVVPPSSPEMSPCKCVDPFSRVRFFLKRGLLVRFD